MDRIKLLKLLEKNCMETPENLALKLNADVEEVKKEIKALQAEGVIAGYRAIINWDKAQSDWAAVYIELKVNPGVKGYDDFANRLYQIPQVNSVYLMSGGYDFLLVIEGQSLKDVALFVAEHLSPMEGVISTTTHFVLKKYKESGKLLDGEKEDGRQVITF